MISERDHLMLANMVQSIRQDDFIMALAIMIFMQVHFWRRDMIGMMNMQVCTSDKELAYSYFFYMFSHKCTDPVFMVTLIFSFPGFLYKGNSAKHDKKQAISIENRRNTYSQFHPSACGREPSVLTTFSRERKQLMAVRVLFLSFCLGGQKPIAAISLVSIYQKFRII